MRLLRKIRIVICLAFVSLLLFGKPICLNFDCELENSIDQFEVKSTDNVSYVHSALKTCKPIDLTCERISFNAFRPPFVSDIAKLRISMPIAIFAISGVFQLVILLCAISSNLNKKDMFCGLTFLDILYCIEILTYVNPFVFAVADNFTRQYIEFASTYRAGYFVAVNVLYGISFYTYLMDIFVYSIDSSLKAGEN